MRNSFGQRGFFVLGVLALLAGCATHGRPTPPLEAAPVAATAPAKPEKSWMTKTADATWGVVEAPVKLVKSLGAKKEPAKVEEVEPPEPADAIIVQRAPAMVSGAAASQP